MKMSPTQKLLEYQRKNFKRREEILSNQRTMTLEEALAQLERTSK